MDFEILRPGRNVWRIERASRAAVLVDAAPFFAAVRAACLKARKSIFIVGWDIDSRTRLVGADGEPSDGFPAGLADFLGALVAARPELHVHLLLWDYSLLYAGERELLPRLSLGWSTPERITLCLDSSVPFGCSQHQKIVVIDDALAFSGGLDLTIRRWDTQAHDLDNPHRVDPAGRPYRPFHDVQMMVDGAAARALAELARLRWCHANGGEPAVAPVGDPWPEAVAPDFTDVDVGIARTQPRYGSEQGVHEVEALFLDSIDKARRSIYIENQFVTCPVVAGRLARQLRAVPDLEVVIVAPRSHDSWIERRTMRNGRIRFWRTLRKVGGARVRLLFAAVEKRDKATDTMIHSKIMIVDDRLLRVGSANLDNRSMGVDTECDLAVEARTEGERAAILRLRDRLVAEHCGVTPEEVARAVRDGGSLIAAVDGLAANGHSLRPIEDGEPDDDVLSSLGEEVADPKRPLRLRRLLHRFRPKGPQGSGLALGIAVAFVLIGLTLAWRFTGLSEYASIDGAKEVLSGFARNRWAPLSAIGLFTAGGVLAFPVTMMIVAMAATFGPLPGLLYAVVGALLSGTITYWIGARFGREAVFQLLGRRREKAQAMLRRRGVLAVVAIRVVPLAPFAVINLICGASGVRTIDFVLGSLIGMGPGTVALAFLGDRIVALLADPDPTRIALFVLALAAWIGATIGVQALVSRLGDRA